jgi:hypothetical protein
MAELFREGGCLTEEGIRLFKRAPLGKTPDELARHLADCLVCQRRVLSEDNPLRARGATAKAPSWGRLAFFVAIVLVMAALALFTMVRLRSGG